MTDCNTILSDVVILGGGVAGLWLLDHLRRAGYGAVLVEKRALGAGQTVASQGIIHGGLKYMFDGHLTAPAKAISEMPVLWREALAGARQPDLSGTTIRSDCCYIWGTGSIKSRIFIKGSALALRAAPSPVDRADAPQALADVPGSILRVPEQVIDPGAMTAVLLKRNAGRVARAEAVDFTQSTPSRFRLRMAGACDGPVCLETTQLVLTAGAGNEALRAQLGLPGGAMQRRPLHMAMVRGDLPELFGHCVGGPKPRITVTSARDSAGRMVWQVGGQLAEDGVAMDAEELRRHLRDELGACLPGLNLAGVQACCYRVDRAEAATGGERPDDVHVMREGRVITAWPTKLALAPRLAERVAELLLPPSGEPTGVPDDLPAPAVAAPPWETATDWELL